MRYNPVYLFDFLKNPSKIRRHIGPAIMPNFSLTDAEALALTLYLESQDRPDASWPRFPASLNNSQSTQQNTEDQNRSSMLVILDTTCLSCHSLKGKRGGYAVDLETMRYRLKAEWVKKYLCAPSLFDVPNTTMLAVFYTLSRDRIRLIRILPDAADQINRITDYLFSMNSGTKADLEKIYQKVLTENSELDSEIGEQIFRSLNCTACHTHRTIEPAGENAAPDLSIEGFRVQRDWLSRYLEKPYSIRPHGYQPGTRNRGNRMPNFEPSPGKLHTLGEFLADQKRIIEGPMEVYLPQDLTAFSMQKAQTMLEDKFSCLGCHRLGDQGGKIGPDLASVRSRLNPSYIYNQIRFPETLSPNTIMPRIPIQDKTQKLLFHFLLQTNSLPVDPSFITLTENKVHIKERENENHDRYLRHCAICHGEQGRGDGYNAQFLPVRPTAHADSAYMSTRPDDTLFDLTFTGGYIFNKHHFMPPWGWKLSREEIQGLVTHIRKLSNSHGPVWSRDNKINNQ